MLRPFMAYWPMIAGFAFWVGAGAQIREILVLETAAGVESYQWLLYSFLLAGYVLFDRYYLQGRARTLAVIASSVSAGMYLVIFVLTLLY